MKIPKTFLPEKNLDKEYSHLMINEFEHKEPREVTLEELMKDNMNVLYGGATGYQRDEITETAISKIINDTFENKITWEEDTNKYEHVTKGYKTKVTIMNYRRERITVQALFLISENLLNLWCFLHLGSNKSPCRTNYHKEVKKLAVEHFELNPNTFPR